MDSTAVYCKNKGKVYFDLLNLAKVSDKRDFSQIQLNAVVNTLNQLESYQRVHKRLIPLLNDKAYKLKIFEKLEPNIQQLLSNKAKQGIVTELAKEQQLSLIITAFAEHNIPIILLKGAAFSGVLYTRKAPRISDDLDILVKKKDWKQASLLLHKIMDYKEKKHPDVFGDLYELCFIPKKGIGIPVDLHNALVNPSLFSINEKELWGGSIKHLSFNNELVRMLSAEYAIIHQALHAYKDMDFAKYNLVDTYEILTQLKPDINKVINIAHDFGCKMAMYQLLNNSINIMGSNTIVRLEKLLTSSFRLFMANALLQSRFTQPQGNKKPLRYRINQVLGQYVFSDSIVRPLVLQWLYVKSTLITTRI